jgi:hypothetical protein
MGDTRIPRGRAGFSGSTKQNARYAKLGLPATIKELLNPFTSNVLSGPAPTDSGAPLDPVNHWGHDCLWWLDRMVRSRNQLQERMTLSLHDLFATSNAGVGNTRHMLRQNRLLRSHALGNFADLLQKITIGSRDAAVAERRRLEQVGAQRELRAAR